MEVKTKTTHRGKSIAACLILFILLLTVLLVTLTGCNLFGSEIYLEHFDVDMTLGADGSLTVTEECEAYFTPQDSDWYNFYRIIDGVTDDVSIKFATNAFYVDGRLVSFASDPIDVESKSADYWRAEYRNKTEGYFNVNSQGIEVGALMPSFSSGTHTFKYTYVIENYMTGIADAAVFYHKYVSEINTMDVKSLKVTLHFPQAEPDLRAWLHTSASAEGVWKVSDDGLSMTVLAEGISAGEYVESRVLLDKSHYTLAKVEPGSSVDVEREEQAWYDAYERERKLRLAVTILDYVLAVLMVAVGILMTIRFKRQNRPMPLPDAPIYYRDIPEGYTGGEVSPLYFYYSSENYIDESISASMLELVRKGYITIMPDEKAKSAKITVLKQDENDEIPTHQKYVIEMLLMVKPLGTSFTMKEFESCGKHHPEQMMRAVEKYKAAILNKSKRDGCYQKRNPILDKVTKYSSACVFAGVAVILLTGFATFLLGQGMTFFGIGLILSGVIPYLFLRKAKAPLTLDGQREYDKLHALAKYMQEFSMMKDHEIPELALWEDYMIFATAMGIADKVAKQLEIAYPEFKAMNASRFDAGGLLILYFFSPSFRMLSGLNFVGNMASVMRSVNMAQKALRAANLASKIGGIVGGASGRGGGSSFHGGGGGFSGGGFGGRR